MVDTRAFCCSITLRAFIFLFVLAAMVAYVQGGGGCPRFSCGHLKNISSPFRRRGDPPGCGSQYYELMCRDSKATIRIGSAVYYVVDINYTGLFFSAIESNLDTSSNCPLPYSSPEIVDYFSPEVDSHGLVNLEVGGPWACFANCSRAITNNSRYKPVACLTAKNSFVYVWVRGYCDIMHLEHSCGYLAMAPFDLPSSQDVYLGNASYADIMGFVSKGFAVRFPHRDSDPMNSYYIIKLCLSDTTSSYFKERISDASILNRTRAFFWSEIHFFDCLHAHHYITKSIVFAAAMVYVIDVPRFLVVLCRFVLAPLVVLIFLAYKYWKTRITIDAVEKFLLMQEMLGPTRYAYTDITAITSHFRDKLGQGGYGSVFKGVLLPGNVHVAVKMLDGNSNCKGEDFISEVSTIGRIHHVNVVDLLGFCSEEMRRALVYEYMPRGSLDKYIFSAEKTFSWDKLNEIALGIARGINYLHQGCEMQILHFDIKPHNILLDSNFVPKVADFGLAKLYPRGNSLVPLSALRGTIGYIAPEMISRSFGVISSKSDVYSFGMLLLEMAGGRRNADPNVANSSQSYYPSWVYDQLTGQEVGEISLVDNMHELEKKLCIVGLWCIQMRSQDRPTMSEVIEMLEGGIDSLQMPSRPFFCDDGHTHAEGSYHLSSELTTISEEDQ
ncbi:serine/threonine-protein kinase-like protein CR4 isoform X1 [Lolium rigidum]|uniref:serine/threonine-protein kinase-like protein CR4 isoform X1 n=1 Tax=Lolium rigidum TaxID=89674 RepID=UPI001F5C3F4A|nr:serine/threonine-protein kinase-like protein CR4 isoform X1 [Lolium rigidum]